MEAQGPWLERKREPVGNLVVNVRSQQHRRRKLGTVLVQADHLVQDDQLDLRRWHRPLDHRVVGLRLGHSDVLVDERRQHRVLVAVEDSPVAK